MGSPDPRHSMHQSASEGRTWSMTLLAAITAILPRAHAHECAPNFTTKQTITTSCKWRQGVPDLLRGGFLGHSALSLFSLPLYLDFVLWNLGRRLGHSSNTTLAQQSPRKAAAAMSRLPCRLPLPRELLNFFGGVLSCTLQSDDRAQHAPLVYIGVYSV